ncbi:hypothetical protein HDU86_004601, partial [Geranomyces michiganensis]
IAALGRSVACDPFLAVAYFMRGVCYYNVNALNESLNDFNDSLTYLRGNTHIDYAQLGLAFKLFACEVSFNRGLCLAAMGQMDDAYRDFEDAARSRPPPSSQDGGSEDFRNIDEALKLGDRAPEYLGPYAVSPDSIYRPPGGRVKNSEKRDYIGKAKVVASVEATDNYAGFSGRELKMKTLPRSNSTNDIPTFPADRLMRANTSTGVLSRSATVAAPGSARVVGGGVTAPNANAPPATMLRPLRNRSSSLGISEQLPPPQLSPRAGGGGGGGGGRQPAISINPIDELMSELGSGGGGDDDDRYRYRNNNNNGDRDRDRDDRGYANNGYGGSNNNGASLSSSPSSYNNNNNSRGPPPTESASARATIPRAGSPTGTVSTVADKVKLKAHYQTTRILLLPTVIRLPDLIDRLQDKFGLPAHQRFQLKYKDEDGAIVTIVDQEDLEVAWAVQGVEWGEGGRVEVWCEVR